MAEVASLSAYDLALMRRKADQVAERLSQVPGWRCIAGKRFWAFGGRDKRGPVHFSVEVRDENDLADVLRFVEETKCLKVTRPSSSDSSKTTD